jgi:hypothetical protein
MEKSGSEVSAQDKRQTPRLDIEKVVHILNGETRIACKLTDVSKSGARLGLDDSAGIPEEFEIVLRDGLRKWCRVMRRSEKQIGIKFIAPPTAKTDTPAVVDAPSITPESSPAAEAKA